VKADDDYLLSVADAVLDARPIDWAEVARHAPVDQRALIAGLQSISSITAFHLDSTIATSADIETGDDDAGHDGSTWGPFTLTERIGRGRFGDVYRALDPRLDRPVALKLLKRSIRESDDSDSAVIDEGRLMARVRHPSVMTVYGAERIDGRVGLWMELIEGRTLEEELRERGPMAWREAGRIGIALCEALDAVHDAGLLHRDLKAQNVLHEASGRIVLADFGAGRALVTDPPDQVDVAGTPLYLAPEVFAGRHADVTSDVYSLGVLIFHLLTGSYPVRGRNIADVREAHHQGRRSSLREAHSRVPATFAAAVDRALAVDPADRHLTADAFRIALERGLIEPETPRRLLRLAVVAGVTLSVAAVLAIALVSRRSPPDNRGNFLTASDGTQASSLRKVRLPSFNVGIGSHDGRVFPYVDEGGRLQLWEVATGKSQLIAEPVDAPEAAGKSVASPTGDRVAFGWSLGPGGFELRLVNADGSWPRVLLTRQTAYEPVPVDWSHDGHAILCWLYQKNGSADLVSIPADGSPLRLLYNVTAAAPSGARFSPDGRFVVLTEADGPQASTGSLVTVDAQDATRHVLASGVVKDVNPVWMPDGRRVLFVRKSTEVNGSFDAWTMDVSDGAAQGEPARLLPNIGIAIVAVTSRGEFFRLTTKYTGEVYTAAIDLTGSREAGAPARISAAEVGNHVAPSWSPDGRSIAYFTIREPEIPGATPLRSLTIQDVTTGQARRLQLPLGFLSGYTPRWSPDSRFVVVFGSEAADPDAIVHYRVDVHTGGLEAIVRNVDTDRPPMSAYAPDGIDYLYIDPSRGIVARRLDDGSERVVVSEGGTIGRFDVAPDGAIAMIRRRRRDDRWMTTLEVRGRDGVVHEVLHRMSPRQMELHGWTPDGEGLIYSEGKNANEPFELFRIPALGRPSVDLRFSMVPTPNPIRLSPDGRRIAYTERIVERELWITPLPP